MCPIPNSRFTQFKRIKTVGANHRCSHAFGEYVFGLTEKINN